MGDLADDLLGGAKEIAKFTGESPRRTYYLLETRKLPGFKLGEKWYARKSRLIAHYEALERAAQSAA